MKTTRFLFRGILFFLFSLFFIESAEANVYINEVQIKPIEERFIELYNSGPNEVSLTGWYIQRKTEKEESNFTSLVSKTYFENKRIPPNGFFVISRTNFNQADIIIDNLTLTDSNTIQLKSSSQKVEDVIAWGDVSGSSVANPPEGRSINRTSDGWIIGMPTPRKSNTQNVDEEIDECEEEDVKKGDTGFAKINSRIIIPKTIMAGVPFLLGSETVSNKGGTYYVGKFVWNFGDGRSFVLKDNKPFEYTYEYPGDYLLSLSYYNNLFIELPDSSVNLKVKVIPAEIVISSVGDQQDAYVEIENKTNYDVSLSGWTIRAGYKNYTLPDGMTISAKNKIKISPKITNFIGIDLSKVSISSPNLAINSSYVSPNNSNIELKTMASGVQIVPKSKTETEDLVIEKIVENKGEGSEPLEVFKEEESSPENLNLFEEEDGPINLNLLSASAGDAEKTKIIYPIVGLGVVIFLGITSVFLLKKKDSEGKIDINDFDLVE